MTKSITITYQEADEGLLMAFFKRLKIAINSEKKTDDDHEIEVVRKRLHDKYVVTGQWAKMNDEEREDAAHVESMIYAKEQPDYLAYSVSETKEYLMNLRSKLMDNAIH
jgi:hypothetical protein